jgi:hypothetical protein
VRSWQQARHGRSAVPATWPQPAQRRTVSCLIWRAPAASPASIIQACLDAAIPALSGYLGEFLLVKCFFFLALMRPTAHSRPGKHAKWQYRRALFTTGLEQYESTGTVDPAAFPTFAEFTGSLAAAARP